MWILENREFGRDRCHDFERTVTAQIERTIGALPNLSPRP